MLYVLGIGSGNKENMSFACYEAIQNSDIIVGYDKYVNQIENLLTNQEIYSTAMTGEIQRCKKAVEFAKNGKNVSVICSGDSGIYAMSGLILELVDDDMPVKIIPGITSSTLASSLLGAPIMHDCCTISLSDLLTPLELIYKRVEYAAMADFVISFYNPKSKKRADYLKNSVEILLKYKKDKTPVGIVKRAYDENQEIYITTLDNIDYSLVDMHSIVIVGNNSSYIKNGKIITKRGYETKYKEEFNE
jgi:precorrin-3B C(17)-methyltransferase